MKGLDTPSHDHRDSEMELITASFFPSRDHRRWPQVAPKRCFIFRELMNFIEPDQRSRSPMIRRSRSHRDLTYCDSYTMLHWLLQCASKWNSNRLPCVLWLQRLELLSRFHVSRVQTSFLWISRSMKPWNEIFVVLWVFSSFWDYTADLSIIAMLLIMLIFAINDKHAYSASV